MADVSVLHHVGFAFDSQFTGVFDFDFTAVFDQIIQRVNVDADKSLFKVRVDDAGGLRSHGADWNRPSANFFFASSKVTLQT